MEHLTSVPFPQEFFVFLGVIYPGLPPLKHTPPMSHPLTILQRPPFCPLRVPQILSIFLTCLRAPSFHFSQQATPPGHDSDFLFPPPPPAFNPLFFIPHTPIPRPRVLLVFLGPTSSFLTIPTQFLPNTLVFFFPAPGRSTFTNWFWIKGATLFPV